VRTIQELEKKEQSILSKALVEGFENPHDNENGNLLKTTDRLGNEYRRFIKLFKRFEAHELTTDNNIKEHTYSKERVAELSSKWQRKEKLNNPIVVADVGVGFHFAIQGGCNRFASWNQSGLNLGPIPAFVVTEWYDTKTEKLVDTQKGLFLSYLANVRGNPTAKTEKYDMDSVSRHIIELKKLDSTFGGMYPDGIELPIKYSIGCAFDQVMYFVYGENWPYESPTTLGKILQNVNDPTRLEKKKKIKTFDDSAVTLALLDVGWDTGLDQNKKRKSCLEHYDSSDGLNVLIGNDQGHNFEATVMLKILRGYALNEFQASGFKFLGSIHDPHQDLKGLNSQRRALLNNIEIVNKMFTMAGIPTIKSVCLVQQLAEKESGDEQKVYAGPDFVNEFDKLNGQVAQLKLREVM
jgi:hypothetical protein